MYQELALSNNRRDAESLGKPLMQKVRRELESELQMDRNDIRSHGWYHGRLPREYAEKLPYHDGDFIVRESLSNMGEFVLTMKWQEFVLHFKINKFVQQQSPVYSKVQYAFECDSFDSIPSLIMFHVGSNTPISAMSGALIKCPVNRELPLSYTEMNCASVDPQCKQLENGSRSISNVAPSSSVAVQDTKSIRMPGPFPLLSPDNSEQFHLQPKPLDQTDFTFKNQKREMSTESGLDLGLTKVNWHTAEGVDSVGALPVIKKQYHNASISALPPKPSRVPSFRRPVIRHGNTDNVLSHQQSDTNSMENSTLSTSSGIQSFGMSTTYVDSSREMESNSRLQLSQLSLTHSTAPQSITSLLGLSGEAQHCSSTTSEISVFKPLKYTSDLLPEENKPVDNTVMLEITSLLLGTDPFKLARHMTSVDCEVCKINDLGLKEIFLPSGSQLRKDIMERYQCIAFWVAACVLRGGVNKQEKVDVLNVFIQIANELVHSLGNIFGFSAIMHGLMCPQLSGLEDLWNTLQQNYTNNAVTMNKKLCPLMRLLDEGQTQISLESICIPHLLPILRYLESPLPGIPHSSNKSTIQSTLTITDGEAQMPWWRNFPDDSFDSLMMQLNIARAITTSLLFFKKNTANKLHDYIKRAKIYEMFSTNFQLRLLWGYKGADSPRKERYEKFDKFVTLMAKRIFS